MWPAVKTGLSWVATALVQLSVQQISPDDKQDKSVKN